MGSGERLVSVRMGLDVVRDQPEGQRQLSGFYQLSTGTITSDPVRFWNGTELANSRSTYCTVSDILTYITHVQVLTQNIQNEIKSNQQRFR